MKYAQKYGVGRASRKYNKSRSFIYFWKARWDGTVQSLACQCRRPHSHPNQHTEAEWKLIRDMRRRNPNLGMVELWHRLRLRVPTVAQIAEYAGAQSNPEIVAPQSTIYETVVEANAPMVVAIVQAIHELQETVKGIDPTVELDGKVIGKAAQKYRESLYKRTGVIPV